MNPDPGSAHAARAAAARLVVGLGTSHGVRPEAVRTILETALRTALEPVVGTVVGTGATDSVRIAAFATVDRRRDEPGLRVVVEEYGVPLRCYPASELDGVDVPSPSDAVRGHVGTRSVAEAAALLAARDLGGGSLTVPKLRGEHVTVAVAALSPVPVPAPLTISSACTACGACLLTCPERALRPAARRPTVVAPRCTSCGECVEICPADAITLRDEQ